MSELGPCAMCGKTGYPLSYGGPDICPACDCGCFNVNALAQNNAKLTAELRALRAAPASPAGAHDEGPGKPNPDESAA